MKLCFSTLGCTDRSTEEILSLASHYKIPALEIRGVGGIMDNSAVPDFSEECAENTARRFAEKGILPVVLGTSCSFHKEDRLERSVAEGKSALDIAGRLGIPNIRVFGNNLPSEVDPQVCTQRIASAIASLCDYAQPRQIRVLLEVHGDFDRVETLLPLVEQLSEKDNFGLIWDIAHSHKHYGESWYEFYSTFRPLIRHVHVKDLSDRDGSLTPIGQGNIPIVPIVERMLKDGYDGCFSLEWEKKWHPELSEIEPALEDFIRLMEKASTGACFR